MTDSNVKRFPATVAEVIDKYTIAINRGSNDGIKENQRFLIYALSSKEIVDPETQKSLGYLEIVRGHGKVVHLQDHMATIESTTTSPPTCRTIKRKPTGLFAFYSQVEQEEIRESADLMPFDNPTIGDKAKPI